MNRERKVFRVTVILALLVAASFLVFAWARVPRYEGKAVGYWFYKFHQECFPSQPPKPSLGLGRITFVPKPSPNKKTTAALRALDSEAALYLVRRLQPQKGRLWDFYGKHYSRIPSALKPALPPPPNDPTVQQAAMLALIELRESARPAIPGVIQMIVDVSLPAYRGADEDAVQVLAAAHLSTAEIDGLLAKLSGYFRFSEARTLISTMDLSTPGTALALASTLLVDGSNSWAKRRLEEMGAQAKMAVPFLITNLSNPSSAKRLRSIRILGIIGTNATEAVDEVRQSYVHDSSAEVRAAAVQALARIAPDKTNVTDETISPPINER